MQGADPKRKESISCTAYLKMAGKPTVYCFMVLSCAVSAGDPCAVRFAKDPIAGAWGPKAQL